MGNTSSLSIPSESTPAVKPGEKLPTVVATGGGVAVVTPPPAPAGEPAPVSDGLILGKFKDQAALEAAYKELEAKQGGKKDGETVVVEPAAAVIPPAVTIEDATKLLTDKGLDFTKFSNEYATGGALSSASYQELFNAGITAQQIDGFLVSMAPAIAAAKATSELNTNEILEHAGGVDALAKLLAFAKAGAFKAEEIQSYNDAVARGDKFAVKTMLTTLKGQYDTSMGIEPTLGADGLPPGSGSTDIYASISEYHSDMNDPRYARDEAYRNKVTAKLTRSKKLYT